MLDTLLSASVARRMTPRPADSPLSADELQQWVSGMTSEHTAPQPATYTPDTTARVIRGFFDIRGANHPVTQITLPPEHAFNTRINLAWASVAAGLHAVTLERSRGRARRERRQRTRRRAWS